METYIYVTSLVIIEVPKPSTSWSSWPRAIYVNPQHNLTLNTTVPSTIDLFTILPISMVLFRYLTILPISMVLFGRLAMACAKAHAPITVAGAVVNPGAGASGGGDTGSGLAIADSGGGGGSGGGSGSVVIGVLVASSPSVVSADNHNDTNNTNTTENHNDISNGNISSDPMDVMMMMMAVEEDHREVMMMNSNMNTLASYMNISSHQQLTILIPSTTNNPRPINTPY